MMSAHLPAEIMELPKELRERKRATESRLKDFNTPEKQKSKTAEFTHSYWLQAYELAYPDLPREETRRRAEIMWLEMAPWWEAVNSREGSTSSSQYESSSDSSVEDELGTALGTAQPKGFDTNDVGALHGDQGCLNGIGCTQPQEAHTDVRRSIDEQRVASQDGNTEAGPGKDKSFQGPTSPELGEDKLPPPRGTSQVGDLLNKIIANVSRQGRPYSNTAFVEAQNNLKETIKAEVQSAFNEKETRISEAINLIRVQNEHQIQRLELANRTDKAKLTQQIEAQNVAMQEAIQMAYRNAETQLQQQVTKLIRDAEVKMQERYAKQLSDHLEQEKDLKEQVEASLQKTLAEVRKPEAISQQLPRERQRRTTVQMDRSSSKTYVRPTTPQGAIDNSGASNAAFLTVLWNLEAEHYRRMTDLAKKAKLDAIEREQHEAEVAKLFDSQIRKLQQPRNDVVAIQQHLGLLKLV